MAEGSQRGEDPRQPDEAILTGTSITYGPGDTDEHVLTASLEPVGLGEYVEEVGEPIVQDTYEPTGEPVAGDCHFRFQFSNTEFWVTESGWQMRKMLDGTQPG